MANIDSVPTESLFAELAAMSTFLREAFGSLSAEHATWRQPAGTFAPVEHCWHLVDLERDGFGVRIRRLLSEMAPVLPDFDGARVAEVGRYLERSLADGLNAFQAARTATLEQLRVISPLDWSRSGTQEGVGVVALSDIPRLIAVHDAAHRLEIDEWLRTMAR
jgi:hypothetical protein